MCQTAAVHTTGPDGKGRSGAERIGFVSTYPPAVCGLASYTSSLRQAMAGLRGTGRSLHVVSVVAGDRVNGSQQAREVIGRLDPGTGSSVRKAAQALNRLDTVILQHEYGIWGPRDGSGVLDLADRLTIPLITTLHTVSPAPTDRQRFVLEQLAHASTAVTVFTESAKHLLVHRYSVDPGPVVVIPHGTSPMPSRELPKAQAGRPPILLTWGLIGPGKGLEHALRSVGLLRYLFPGLRYVIAGRTHPKVLDSEGEAYRDRLRSIVRGLNLGRIVEFVDGYLPPGQLEDLLRQATLVVLPYDSTEQAVSGVLSQAVAAHIPVVATEFPHARELASDGAVVTVRHQDPEAMADAIAALLESEEERKRIFEAQRRISPSLTWATVAASHERVVARRAPVRVSSA